MQNKTKSRRGGGQSGCERRIEVIVKMRPKNHGGGEVRSGVGACGCEPIIEVICKNAKKKSRGGGLVAR